MIKVGKFKIEWNAWISFLIMGGTPIIMLLVFYFLGFDKSTFFVVVTKLVLFFSILFFLIGKKRKKISNNVLFLFSFFWFFWFFRVFYDSYINTSSDLMLETQDYFLFAFFFAIMPFVYGNVTKSKEDVEKVLKGILIGNVLFCIVVLILFYNVLAEGHRLGSKDNSVNPLVISYIASMNIGIYIWKIVVRKFTYFSLFIIVINIPVVGLGASKGGVLALVMAILIVMIVIRKINYKLFIPLILIWVAIANAEVFGLTTIVDRFNYSIEANASSGEKELRYYLWKFSLQKFYEHPFFGYYTELKGNESFFLGKANYPHNIILESFMSLGIVGGGLLLLIILLSIKHAIKISKRDINESWILLLFLIAFYQNMFSGNIYSGALWFWFFVGIVNGRYLFISRMKKKF